MNWFNPNEAPTQRCNYCGDPCDGSYCSKYCEKGDVHENCRDES